MKIFETDVRWTKDGVPILMHDPEVDRTTNGTGKVADLTIAEIDALELDNGAGKVPHFEEFLKRAKNDNVQVWPEYKPEDFNQAWIDDYARLIKDTGVDAVVPSFKKDELAQFKEKLPPTSRSGSRTSSRTDRAEGQCGARGCLRRVDQCRREVREPNMADLNKAGIEVLCLVQRETPRREP